MESLWKGYAKIMLRLWTSYRKVMEILWNNFQKGGGGGQLYQKKSTPNLWIDDT